jgi:hypothetical protein
VETRVEGGPGDDVISVSGWVDDLRSAERA